MELANPDGSLKPEMFGTATLLEELGEQLALPDSAVMRDGEHTYAFKAGAGNQLVPVHITLGAHSGNWFEVIAGLQAGDKVVTSSNFLVDSESSMKAALAGMTSGSEPPDAEKSNRHQH